MRVRFHAEGGIYDVLTGKIDPRQIFRWMAWWPEDSALVASMNGGRDYYGWDTDRYMAKAQWDLTAQIASGKKKAPTLPSPSDVKKGPSTDPLAGQRPAGANG